MKAKQKVLKSQFWRIFRDELKGEGGLTYQHPKTMLETLKGKPQLGKHLKQEPKACKPLKEQIARKGGKLIRMPKYKEVEN